MTFTVGANIRAERVRRGMTLADLCEEAGLSVPVLSRIENGHRIPTIDELDRIAKVLSVDRDLLSPKAAA
tara:strand:- start:1081 stop:1290 length:210 start_codon:yes stop_codon:yes gene_type:complete